MGDQVDRRKSQRWVSVSQGNYDGAEWESDFSEDEFNASPKRQGTISKLPKLPKLDIDLVTGLHESAQAKSAKVDDPKNLVAVNIGSTDSLATSPIFSKECATPRKSQLSRLPVKPISPSVEAVNRDLDTLMDEISKELTPVVKSVDQFDINDKHADAEQSPSCSVSSPDVAPTNKRFSTYIDADIGEDDDEESVELGTRVTKDSGLNGGSDTEFKISRKGYFSSYFGGSVTESLEKGDESASSSETVVKAPTGSIGRIDKLSTGVKSKGPDSKPSPNNAAVPREIISEMEGQNTEHSDSSLSLIGLRAARARARESKASWLSSVSQHDGDNGDEGTEDDSSHEHEHVLSRHSESDSRYSGLYAPHKGKGLNSKSHMNFDDNIANLTLTSQSLDTVTQRSSMSSWHAGIDSSKDSFLQQASPVKTESDVGASPMHTLNTEERVLTGYHDVDDTWEGFPSVDEDDGDLESILDTTTIYDNQTLYNVPGVMVLHENAPPLPTHLADINEFEESASATSFTGVVPEEYLEAAQYLQNEPGSAHSPQKSPDISTRQSIPPPIHTKEPAAVLKPTKIPQLDLRALLEGKTSHKETLKVLNEHMRELGAYDSGLKTWINYALTSTQISQESLFDEYKFNSRKDAYSTEEHSKLQSMTAAVRKKAFPNAMKVGAKGLFSSIGKKL